ncbi:MAG: hypothetical protein LBI71_05500 [Enterobacteriaceae bacterium]|jgi:hypothetical protein|nr:hypothetical protein [Enterobacteriaceae bacterium]
MSVYQFYHFERLDGVLSSQQKASLRTLSSRAEISSSHFTVHYNYGDLKAEPADLMISYFDIGFFYADWGQVVFYLKVPVDAIPPAFMCIDDGEFVECEKRGSYLLFTFSRNEMDEYINEDEIKDYLDYLVELRTELMEGDYRLLYLHWLRSAFEGDDTLDKLPLIDFDFKQLSDAQDAFAQLFDIPPEAYNALEMLLDNSESHSKPEYLLGVSQVDPLTESDKDLILKSLFKQGQITVNQARELISKPLTSEDYQYWLTPESLKPYWKAANEEVTRQRLLAEEQKRKQEQRETLNRLNAIFSSKETHWANAEKNSEKGSGSGYEKAARGVVDLYYAYHVNNALEEFIPLYQAFFKQIEKRRALVQRLTSLNQEIEKHLGGS